MRNQHASDGAGVWVNHVLALSTSLRAAGQTFFSKHGICALLGWGMLLSPILGCGKEEPIVEELRSLKTITVGDATSGQERKFSGVVRAVDRSGLSFEVPGNVLAVHVDIGADVEEGADSRRAGQRTVCIGGAKGGGRSGHGQGER